MAVACLSVFCADAQKVVSRSRIAMVIKEEKPPKEKPPKEKVDYPYNFFVKAGGGVNILHNQYVDVNPIGAFNVAFGFQKQCNRHGLYWGAQLGVSNIESYTYAEIENRYWVNHYSSYAHYHWDYEDDDEAKGVGIIYLGPVLGFKKPVSSNVTFDGHIGASYCVSLGKYTDWKRDVYCDGVLQYSDENRTLAHGPVWELGLGLWIKRFLVELEYRGFYDIEDDHANTSLLLNFGFKF